VYSAPFNESGLYGSYMIENDRARTRAREAARARVRGRARERERERECACTREEKKIVIGVSVLEADLHERCSTPPNLEPKESRIVCLCMHVCLNEKQMQLCYGVATISRLLKIISLFCKRTL